MPADDVACPDPAEPGEDAWPAPEGLPLAPALSGWLPAPVLPVWLLAPWLPGGADVLPAAAPAVGGLPAWPLAPPCFCSVGNGDSAPPPWLEFCPLLEPSLADGLPPGEPWLDG